MVEAMVAATEAGAMVAVTAVATVEVDLVAAPAVGLAAAAMAVDKAAVTAARFGARRSHHLQWRGSNDQRWGMWHVACGQR